jgi:hypothetical protein
VIAKPKHPPGPPMTLGNMREIGAQRHQLSGGRITHQIKRLLWPVSRGAQT